MSGNFSTSIAGHLNKAGPIGAGSKIASFRAVTYGDRHNSVYRRGSTGTGLGTDLSLLPPSAVARGR